MITIVNKRVHGAGFHFIAVIFFWLKDISRVLVRLLIDFKAKSGTPVDESKGFLAYESLKIVGNAAARSVRHFSGNQSRLRGLYL